MRSTIVLFALMLATPGIAQETIEISGYARVRVETTKGDFVLELDAVRAPITVQNFLQYVVDDHYDGTIFHRVEAGFIAQGGGYLPDMTLKAAERAVFNESGNGLANLRGTVGMARSGEPHAATAQFYINLIDNPELDPNPRRWGYAVFGRVVEGMEVIDAIGSVSTGAAGDFDRYVPVEPIVIERIELIRE